MNMNSDFAMNPLNMNMKKCREQIVHSHGYGLEKVHTVQEPP